MMTLPDKEEPKKEEEKGHADTQVAEFDDLLQEFDEGETGPTDDAKQGEEEPAKGEPEPENKKDDEGGKNPAANPDWDAERQQYQQLNSALKTKMQELDTILSQAKANGGKATEAQAEKIEATKEKIESIVDRIRKLDPSDVVEAKSLIDVANELDRQMQENKTLRQDIDSVKEYVNKNRQAEEMAERESAFDNAFPELKGRYVELGRQLYETMDQKYPDMKEPAAREAAMRVLWENIVEGARAGSGGKRQPESSGKASPSGKQPASSPRVVSPPKGAKVIQKGAHNTTRPPTTQKNGVYTKEDALADLEAMGSDDD